jgi:hypothetical protein
MNDDFLTVYSTQKSKERTEAIDKFLYQKLITEGGYKIEELLQKEVIIGYARYPNVTEERIVLIKVEGKIIWEGVF